MLALLSSICLCLAVAVSARLRFPSRLASITYKGNEFYKEFPTFIKTPVFSPFNADYDFRSKGLDTTQLKGKWVVVNQWPIEQKTCDGAPAYTWAYKADQVEGKSAKTAICEPYYKCSTYVEAVPTEFQDKLSVTFFDDRKCRKASGQTVEVIFPRDGEEGPCFVTSSGPSKARYVINV